MTETGWAQARQMAFAAAAPTPPQDRELPEVAGCVLAHPLW